MVASALLLSACSAVSSGPERTTKKSSKSAVTKTKESVTVTGPWGEAPTMSFATPLADTHTRSEVLVEGDGAKIHDGDAVLLGIYATSGTTGEVMRNDFASVPQAYEFSVESLGSDLYGALKGVRVGSRVLHVLQDTVPLVMTIDIYPLSADGTAVADVPTKSSDGGAIPKVTVGADGTPVVSINPKAKAPQVLTTVSLLRGDGPQVQAGQSAVIRYVAAQWSTGKVSGSTWKAGSLPATVKIGADKLIEGLDAALTEVPAGSRILVIAPPGQAFGLTEGKLKNETMVYVIDVLAASAEPSTTSASATPDSSGSSPTKGAS